MAFFLSSGAFTSKDTGQGKMLAVNLIEEETLQPPLHSMTFTNGYVFVAISQWKQYAQGITK